MIVLILVLVWAAALLPIALKKRSEWELSSSISQFRQRRRALVGFAPAGAPSAWVPPGDIGPGTAGDDATGLRGVRGENAARARLKARAERRRRALGALGGTFLASLVFGAIPALRPLWDLALVAGLGTAAYVGALVYFRRVEELALERKRKVVELTARARQSAVAPIRPRPPFVIVEATS